jgi:hypothetical protein
MKKLSAAALALCLAAFPAAAQMAVTAPLLEGLFTAAQIENVAKYAMMVENMVETATNSYNQVQNLMRMEERVVKNLKGAKNIRSFDDFKNWYNRGLYLEKQAEDIFNSIGVQIGDKTYSLTDINEIPDALEEAFTWDTEFSEKQVRDMWLWMGVSPANYAYIKTWREREQAAAKQILAARAIHEEERKAALEEQKEISDALKEDEFKDEDDKMGEKTLLEYSLRVQMDTNREMSNLADQTALANELALIQMKQNETAPNSDRLSESWNAELFDTLKE